MIGFFMPCGKSVNYSKFFKELQGLFQGLFREARTDGSRDRSEHVFDLFESRSERIPRSGSTELAEVLLRG
jgi:hypothetical protein